jgi:hypothetical protein
MVGRDDRPDFLWFGVDEFPAGGDYGGNTELRLKLFKPLRTKELGADDQYLCNTRAGNQLARDESCADCLSQSDIIGEQGHRKAAAKGDEIRDLMVIGPQMVTPPVFRCEIPAALDDNGIGQIPIKRGAIQLVFVRREAAPK